MFSSLSRLGHNLNDKFNRANEMKVLKYCTIPHVSLFDKVQIKCVLTDGEADWNTFVKHWSGVSKLFAINNCYLLGPLQCTERVLLYVTRPSRCTDCH